jgi:PAS domain S-box-containing protein
MDETTKRSGADRARGSIDEGGDSRPVDLRELVEHYLDGVFLIVDGKLLHAHYELEEMTGYTAEEALGRPISDFIVPEDSERAATRLRELKEGGPSYPSRYRLRLKDGSERAIEVLSRPIEYQGRHALLSVVRDIERWEQAEDKLRESEERYRVLYEDNPSMYFTVDATGVVLSVNKFGAEQLGYEPGDLVGENVLTVFHEDDKEAVKRQLAECLENSASVASWEFRKVRLDGSMLWVRERARTVTGADGKPMVLIVCEDITEQKVAEEEHRHLEDQIRHAQKLESLGLMAGGIAHDFNNLLVGILGNASQALSKLEENSPARADIQNLEKAADRAAELCKQLLAYSGRGRFEVQPLDLSELVQDLSGLLEVAVSRKGLLRYELAPGLPPVEADAAQLRQVLMNLVTNASEAMAGTDGSITVSTRVMHLEQELESPVVGTVSPGRYVCLEVADTGCGMDEETLGKMFDPFFTTKFTGRGLGLAAVHGIVRGHEGAIDVRSEPETGTTIRALFPCSESRREVTPRAVPAREVVRGSGTVLVVDDEEIVRDVARQTLEHAGYRVLTAKDGAEGVRAFVEHQDEISVVLLDMTMPGLGGEESFRVLRSLREDIRVLLSSGYDEQEVTSRFESPAPDGFIQKPYRPADLLAKVRDVLRGSGRE